MGIDDPVSLSELLEAHDLRDALHSFARMHGVPVSVFERQDDRSFALLATTAALHDDVIPASGTDMGPLPASEHADGGGGTMLYVAPIMHQGEVIAKVSVGPYRIPYPPGITRHDHSIAAATETTSYSAVPRPITRSDTSRARRAITILEDDRAGSVARHIASVLEILVHNAYARFMISTLHTEATRVNFAELNAKNERLERAVERMQEVDRLKSSFLATMSHELRTPLTSVIGYSEMLIEGLAGELRNEQTEYMKTILSKAEHLLQLITGILDVSMLESGSMELRYDPLDMPELVESVIATVRPTMRTRRIRFYKPPNILPKVVGDRQKIREIIRNLLTNAIKFTPEGGQIQVTMDTGSVRPDELDDIEGTGTFGEPAVRVTITDSGIGMSAAEQERIFDPFFQVDSSSTRQYGGSGLGLTLTKRYVEALGGNIWVDSKPGSGSSFTVALPARLPELGDLSEPGEAAPSSATPGDGTVTEVMSSATTGSYPHSQK